MSVQQQRGTATTCLTAEEFARLPETEGVRAELVEGCVVEMPPAGVPRNEIAFHIAFLIYQFVRQHRLGWASGDGTGYVIFGERESVLVPDASFVAAERIAAEGKPETYWPFAPDLSVEVVSPNDSAAAIHDKVWRYLEAGTRLVWVIWPERRQITEFGVAGIRELGIEDTLDGGEVLPGFSVAVADIFAVADSNDD